MTIIKFVKLYNLFDIFIRLGVLRRYIDFILSKSSSSRVID